MSLRRLLLLLPFLALSLVLAGVAEGRGRAPLRDALYQVSTLAALIDGDYAGRVAYREVMQRGDLGLGTFEALDGEMVAVDGAFYQVPADGRPRRVDPAQATPFAAVTFFRPDQEFAIDAAAGCAELLAAIEARLPPGDAPTAIRIEGRFTALETRSVAAQSEPWPPLADALAGQIVFDLFDVDATLVGFWLPPELGEVNAVGFHLHGLTADRRHGGHVLDCRPDAVRVALERIDSLEVQLGDVPSRPPPHPAHPAHPRREPPDAALAPW